MKYLTMGKWWLAFFRDFAGVGSGPVPFYQRYHDLLINPNKAHIGGELIGQRVWEEMGMGSGICAGMELVSGIWIWKEIGDGIWG